MMNKVLTLTAAAFIATSGMAFAQDSVVIEVPQSARDYVIAHPADPVVIEGDVSEGYVIPERVIIHPIPESPGYGYIYVDDRPVIVAMENRRVVYLSDDSPVIPEDAITYIERNPVDTVMIDGSVRRGAIIPRDVPLVEIPDQPRYSYVYVDERPALIDTGTRRVLWVR
jgi:Protein of unknown function (DUF1236)